MPRKKTSTSTLENYTERRGLPLSFLTEDTEESLTDEDLQQMVHINGYSVFKKRIDAHIRKAFAGMTKDSFEVQRAVMEALASLAFEFEESEEAWRERQQKQKQMLENSVPNPFPDMEPDLSKGEVPDDN